MENTDFALARFTTTGALDTTFSNKGKVITNIGSKDNPSFIALQSDDKIVVNGISNDPSSGYNSVILLRYTASGALDNSFGTSGIVHTDVYGSDINPFTWKYGRIYALGREEFLNTDAGLLAAFKANSSTTSGLPVVSIGDFTVTNEGDSAKLIVSLDKTSTSPITVNYVTEDGTATSKGRTPDYKATRSALTFSAGSTLATIGIATYNDNVLESGETFSVNLSLSQQMAKLATIGDTTGVVTISANDGGQLTNIVTQANNLDNFGEQGKLIVKAYPNPSTSYFTLQLQSASTEPVSIRVTDVLGRMVEAKAGVAANSTVHFGHTNVPGVYYAQVLQGTNKATVRLTKLNQ